MHCTIAEPQCLPCRHLCGEGLHHLAPPRSNTGGIAPSSQQLWARFQHIFASKLGQQLTTSVARLQMYNWAIQTFFWWQHSGKRGAKASGFTRETTGPYFSRWLHHKSSVWIRIFISHFLQHTHTTFNLSGCQHKDTRSLNHVLPPCITPHSSL